VPDINPDIILGIMIKGDPDLNHFMRHLKGALTMGPESFVQVVNNTHMFALINLLNQLKGLVDAGMGEGRCKDQDWGLRWTGRSARKISSTSGFCR
jgi:hypothetical protein